MSFLVHKRTAKEAGAPIPSIQKDDTPIWLLEKQERIKRVASKFLNGDNSSICDFSDKVIKRINKRSKKKKSSKGFVRPADNLAEKKPELIKIAQQIVSEKGLQVSAATLSKEAIDTHFSLKKYFYFDDVRQLVYDLGEIYFGNMLAEKEFEAKIKLPKAKRKQAKKQKPEKVNKQRKKKRKKQRSARPIRELWREANHRYITKQRQLLTDVYVKSLLKPADRTPENIKNKRRQLKRKPKIIDN
jgi:hypothetical protein